MAHKNERELVSVKIRRGTNQKMRVLASLEAMTVQNWINWIVDRAYQAKVGRK